MSKADANDQIKQLETALSFYANATPQELIADAGNRAVGYFANSDPTTQVYARVVDIKKRWSGPSSDSDVQFLLALVEVQRRGLNILSSAVEAVKPALSMLELERINVAYEDIQDMCGSIISKKVIKKPAKSKKAT